MGHREEGPGLFERTVVGKGRFGLRFALVLVELGWVMGGVGGPRGGLDSR